MDEKQVSEGNRLTSMPCLSIKNFSKFQAIGMESCVSNLNTGCILGPTQIILEKSGIFNLNSKERNRIT